MRYKASQLKKGELTTDEAQFVPLELEKTILSQDCSWFVTLNFANLQKYDQVADFSRLFETPKGERNDPLAKFEEFTGLKSEDLERATALAPRAEAGQAMFLVSTRKPFDREHFLKAWGNNQVAEPRTAGGHRYWISGKSVTLFPNDRADREKKPIINWPNRSTDHAFVGCDLPDVEMEKFLTQPASVPGPEHPLTRVLSLAAGQRYLVAGYVDANVLKTMSVILPFTPAEMEPFFLNLSCGVFTLAADRGGMLLSARLIYKDPTAAEKPEKLALTMWPTVSDKMAQELKKDIAEYDAQGEAGKKARQLLEQFLQSVKQAQIRREGSQLELTILFPTDFGTVIRVITEYQTFKEKKAK